MRVFITGSKGQLGKCLLDTGVGTATCGVDLPEYDFTDARAIREAILDFWPDVIVHGGAYTLVDAAESHVDEAFRVNALGTQNVALAAQACGAAMVYISTNEVFDGAKEAPYLEFDAPNPIGVYARSKWAGEQYTLRLVAKHYVVRTAWLYARGGNNFCSKIVQAAGERGEIRAVSDEFGSPTYAPDLAQAVTQLIETGQYGIYHFTNEGVCSRFEWAQEILRLSGRGQVPIRPIHSSEWVRAARSPRYAPLRNFCGAELGIRLRPWREGLAEYFQAEQ